MPTLSPRRAFTVLFFLAAGVATARADCDAPAPTLKIVPPAASFPKSAAAFSGTWQGDWPTLARGKIAPLCARLYVSLDSARTASVEHCTGSLRDAGQRPQCKRFLAQIENDQMTYTDPDGDVVTFTKMDVGGMLAESVNAKHKTATQFQKVQ